MSNSPLVSYTKITPNKTTPRNHEIDTVTIHCYVGQVTVENAGKWFANPMAECSSNYVIGADGRIALIVDEGDRSWCSSNAANDHRAITIEVASDTTYPYAVNDVAYESLINLLVDICKRNPKIGTLKWKADKSLIGQVDKQNMTVHRWFANKSCPGEYLYSRHAQIAAEVNKRLQASTSSTYTLKNFVTDVQKATGAKVDGVAGPETLSKTVTLSAILNRKHTLVYYVQRRLKALGYTEVGTVDGVAGGKFTAAVKHYQKDNGCVADGEITARAMTWKKLLGLA